MTVISQGSDKTIFEGEDGFTLQFYRFSGLRPSRYFQGKDSLEVHINFRPVAFKAAIRYPLDSTGKKLLGLLSDITKFFKALGGEVHFSLGVILKNDILMHQSIHFIQIKDIVCRDVLVNNILHFVVMHNESLDVKKFHL